MTILILIIAILLFIIGIAYTLMAFIASGKNYPILFLDFIPVIIAFTLGIGLLVWWF